MSPYTRNGYRWNINECITLQREFELLELSIDEIADRHKRTPNAIMFKLSSEGFADYNILYSNYHGLNSSIPTQTTQKYDDENDIDNDDKNDIDIDNDDEPFDLDYNPNEEDDYEEDDEDQDDEDQDDEDQDDLKAHVMRLEKQVMNLTKMIMKSSKNKSMFSLFG